MRSPAIPRSAISFKSEAATKRPRGILPGGKVFQVPPPAVEASAMSEESTGAGWAGKTGGAVAAVGGGVTGTGEAAATTIGAFVGAGGLATAMGAAEGVGF